MILELVEKLLANIFLVLQIIELVAAIAKSITSRREK